MAVLSDSSPKPKFTAVRIRLGAGDTRGLYPDGLAEARTGDATERYNDHGALLKFGAAHAPTTASVIVAEIQLLLDGSAKV